MIDDFRPMRDKKRIEPLAPEPKPSVHDLYAAHAATEPDTLPKPVVEADNGQFTPEPSFQTPEEVASSDNPDMLPPVPAPETPGAKPPKKKHGFWQWRWRIGRRWTIALSLVALTLLSLGALAAYQYYVVPEPSGSFASVKGKYEPKTIASNLTGLQVDPSINELPVTGIMIENSLDARPQSGLDQAGIVFEAIAEAGITRFMALFQDEQPDYIGPTRSVRPYYAQWCMSFDCALAHVGGSPEGLASMREWKTKDLDQFANSGAYWRISSRYAPHNMYTSIAKLREVESSKGYGAAKYTAFARKKDTASTTPNATTINFNISSATYNSVFTYDATSNSYKRSQNGAAHTVTDGKGTETQLTPKVVIAMIVPYGLKSDGYHSDYNAVGSGEAFVFQDGTAQKVSWSKASNEAALIFTDADGQAAKLNAGQTWITVLGDTGKLSYQ